jgi:hypothetical protein
MLKYANMLYVDAEHTFAVVVQPVCLSSHSLTLSQLLSCVANISNSYHESRSTDEHANNMVLYQQAPY